LIVLITFFVLANIPLYGLAENALKRFQYLAILLGTDFGSIISLGIGPIVMSSIVLQLLAGSKILNIDLHSEEGKKYFQALQKILTLAFILFEAMVYVLMKGLAAMPGMGWLVIFQLCLGGILILFMDEIVHKWGFGSGVSLFIAAGVGWRLFAELFQFLGSEGTFNASGQILVLFNSLITGNAIGVEKAFVTILATVVIFLIIVWAQSLKVEIPLSFDRIRGYGIRWPLNFFYASVIPVILVSALAANMQLGASLLQNTMGHPTFLGGFEGAGSTPTSGLAFWIHSTPLLESFITGSFRWVYLLQGLCHMLFYIIFSAIFAMFWVATSNMDAASQASSILKSGLNIPGFRKDERVLESILARYITPLTLMGGAAIGLLASSANLLGAMAGGTSILLAVMILYQLYQNIAQQHALDMHPALKGMFNA
jgi:preprotein translocase subunit SecY